MSQNPPQTLSIKRKRKDAPVDALIIERESKKQKSQIPGELPKASIGSKFIFRRLTKPNDVPQQSPTPPTPTTERRFHLDASARAHSRRVFVEARNQSDKRQGAIDSLSQVVVAAPVLEDTARPQKRPGAGSALRPIAKSGVGQREVTKQPSAQDIRELESLYKEVEKQDNLLIPLPSPSKHKPKAPKLRFAQRHPEKAAEVAAKEKAENGDADAMDIDTDDYVYDTYVREAVMPDADGKLPEPTGTVGLLVIRAEDEEFWNGEDESDKEFDTDDEDENAEDYYANDYPEDELDEDDEYDRNLYQKKYRDGSDDWEYDLDADEDDLVVGSGEDEDDLHFKMTVPKAKSAGYWGMSGDA